MAPVPRIPDRATPGRRPRRALGVAGAALAGVVAYDLTQRKHAILRNFPVVGHLRYILEAFGPELRQYIVTGNDEERPFSRNQRRWVYATAKRQDPHFGFGTDTDWSRRPGHVLVKQAEFPLHPPPGGDPAGWPLPCAKVVGARHGRRHAFRPASAVNVSGMSFGALGSHAVEAINRGCAAAGCLHNTGEGGLSVHHQHGAELVFQIGTAYFGCRDERGRFSLPRLQEVVAENPVRAIEIKLSQGAKPGVGGLLPGAKVTPDIAAARGVPVGEDCQSPSGHTEFGDLDGLVEFIERIADATGLPVGVKSAVGEQGFWDDLARRMSDERAGPDFITIDGGEGGTGAGPLAFTDHVALPLRLALSRVYRTFAEAGIADEVVFGASGMLGLPSNALLAFAMGADLVNVGREAMLSVGCIQAQRCHTGRCPTGVATNSAWLQRGLDPVRAGERCANYLAGLRAELVRLARTCGVPHPALVDLNAIELLDGLGSLPAAKEFNYTAGWGLPSDADRDELLRLMGELATVRPEARKREIPTGRRELPRVP
ncbi:FMN-binding glutamate synthase family protein [Miltoncostaea marina]|uniref:FMN-binding glutamate synthase family protein n=1 Tax=Miltoncostaea marina TaxID=2843215 RepID=UPI001C3DE4E4|nr:FMN-binding glutamate synthase family protein [Miltoncostaea marina]